VKRIIAWLIPLGLLGGGAFYAGNLFQVHATLPPAQISTELARSAEAKVAHFKGTHAFAQGTGLSLAVSETFSDGEVNSLIWDQTQGQQLPFANPDLHASASGYFEATGVMAEAGQSLPVYVQLGIDTSGGGALFALKQAWVGQVSVPDFVFANADQAMNQSFNLGGELGLQDAHVNFADGSVTISGRAAS
jgi:hypothetical protein